MKRFQKIIFKNKLGYKLEASLALPKTEPPYPMIIACHGFSSSKDSATYTVLEKRLLPKGMAVFRFNYRAHGKSEGGWKDLTLSGVVNDINSAIDCVFSKYGKIINKDKITLYGSSFSGLPVVCVASRDKRIKYLICRSGVIDFQTRLEKFYDIKKWKKDKKIKSSTNQPKLAWFSYNLYTDSLKYDGFKIGKKIKIPILLMHGSSDITVKPYHSKELFKNLKTKDKTLKLVKGVDHWFHGKRKEMQKIIVDWIEERIKN